MDEHEGRIQLKNNHFVGLLQLNKDILSVPRNTSIKLDHWGGNNYSILMFSQILDRWVVILIKKSAKNLVELKKKLIRSYGKKNDMNWMISYR